MFRSHRRPEEIQTMSHGVKIVILDDEPTNILDLRIHLMEYNRLRSR